MRCEFISYGITKSNYKEHVMEHVMEYKGIEYTIEVDPDPQSPRLDDNFGKMVCFHSRYILGDKHDYKTAQDFLVSIIVDVSPLDPDLDEEAELPVLLERARKDYVILPIYLYDHSGITINTTGFSCRWDSGLVGFIYVRREDAIMELHVDGIPPEDERIEELLLAEVTAYDTYLRGDMYGWTIPLLNESVWGYFGKEDAEADVKGTIEGHLNTEYPLLRLMEEL